MNNNEIVNSEWFLKNKKILFKEFAKKNNILISDIDNFEEEFFNYVKSEMGGLK